MKKNRKYYNKEVNINGKTDRKLGRKTDIRLAMLKSQTTDLPSYMVDLETTLARAKEVKSV